MRHTQESRPADPRPASRDSANRQILGQDTEKCPFGGSPFGEAVASSNQNVYGLMGMLWNFPNIRRSKCLSPSSVFFGFGILPLPCSFRVSFFPAFSRRNAA